MKKSLNCLVFSLCAISLTQIIPTCSAVSNTAPIWSAHDNGYSGYSTALENGEAQAVQKLTVEGFLAVTDGTALSEEMLTALDTDCTLALRALTWEEAAPAFSGEYGENAKFYQIYCPDALDTCDILPDYNRLARSLMLANDGIADVLTLDCSVPGTVAWDGGFMGYIEGDIHPVDLNAALAEDEAYLAAQEVYRNWKSALETWEAETDTSAMTDAEIGAARAAAGIATDQEILEYALDIARNSLSTYDYDVAVILPTSVFTPDEAASDWAADSCWAGMGDTNTDGILNTADAAAVLQYAAALGSGGASADAACASAGDVNADGIVNSEDAAAVLVYTAVIGSGAEITLPEAVK